MRAPRVRVDSHGRKIKDVLRVLYEEDSADTYAKSKRCVIPADLTAKDVFL